MAQSGQKWPDKREERRVSQLEEIIREEIAREGPITFARFMELALYHPQLGYYVGGGVGREPVGWAGDFFTSGDVSPLWGWAIARQLHQMWQALGSPERFDVIEPGAGRGLLAASVWRYALALDERWAAALRYTLVDRAAPDSPLRADRAARLAAELAAIPAPPDAVRWADDLAQATSNGPITGCVVSNELVDALPVHRVEARGGRLEELYVALGAASGQLMDQPGEPSSARVEDYLDRYNILWRDFPDGWRAEVCPAAEDWMAEVAAIIGDGFALTIDYGASARRLYTRDRRRGTLTVYARHHLGERPLIRPGQQDLTAHVNFSALARTGSERGLRVTRYTTQAALLRTLGAPEQAEELAARLFPYADSERQSDRGQADYLRRAALRNAVATLLNPYGLGGFRALIQRRVG
ncbi:MAG TPA: SAM-dependent methyltransferase [Ktedonobacterales bacterium]|jgi:SAM-dependent MidA family methyltransferase|nr:SAM-dependent methyltransferase [Ktedonobacterales bacterium]